MNFEQKLKFARECIDAIPSDLSERLTELLSRTHILETILREEIERYKNLFEKQKALIRDDRYTACSCCGIKVHDNDSICCPNPNCEESVDTCDDCAKLPESRYVDETGVHCKICNTKIEVREIRRNLKVYL